MKSATYVLMTSLGKLSILHEEGEESSLWTAKNKKNSEMREIGERQDSKDRPRDSCNRKVGGPAGLGQDPWV